MLPASQTDTLYLIRIVAEVFHWLMRRHYFFCKYSWR